MHDSENNDLLRLLLLGDNDTRGSHYHLGWDTFPGAQSGSGDVGLTTLHESFHNELNNLTTYGFLLQVYAFLSKTGIGQERFEALLRELVDSRCREAHETYATFISTTITLEKPENKGRLPTELLGNYPGYLYYYNLGMELTNYFKGNYLKEIALTAVIINCFQSRAIYEGAIQDLVGFHPSAIRGTEFPDDRMSVLGKRLPTVFWEESFGRFCEKYREHSQLPVFLATETDASYYQLAIAPANDELQRLLLEHFVQDLAGWMEAASMPCIPFKENITLLKELFALANAHVAPGATGIKLELNEDPKNIPKNILLNFTTEKYHIRKVGIPATISTLASVQKEDWSAISGGSAENEHFYLFSRVAQRLLPQYHLPQGAIEWLNERLDEPLVFLRRRVFIPENGFEQVQLFWVQTPKEWLDFVAAFPNKPFVSCISMHTWAIPDWESIWLDAIAGNSQCTILFDLPPHSQLSAIFEVSCDRVYFNKVWMKHENYRHCALVIQGKLKGSEDRTPLFLLPASETTCNVVSNYMLNQLEQGLCQEDTVFLNEQAWLVNIALGRLFNEERTFDFNTI